MKTFCAVVVLAFFASCSSEASRPKAAEPAYAAGTQVQFKSESMVAATESDLIELDYAVRDADRFRINEIIQEGRAWRVPAGTRFVIVGGGILSNGIEIKLPDGRHAWVGADAIGSAKSGK